MQPQSVIVEGYSGGSMLVPAGARFSVTDVEGQQVADFFALRENNHQEFLSTSITRAVNLSLFPHPGQQFYSTLHQPIVEFVEDHSPGIHDMLFAPCDHELYAARGLMDHPNCRDNYLACARVTGISHKIVPDPVNLFQNTPVAVEGKLELGVAASRSGDHVVLKALEDLIIIVTACSSERVNGGGSTSVKLDLLT